MVYRGKGGGAGLILVGSLFRHNKGDAYFYTFGTDSMWYVWDEVDHPLLYTLFFARICNIYIRVLCSMDTSWVGRFSA